MAYRKEPDNEQSPLDLAARAAWLSFVGGLTQDQIAKELSISRQRAQRLVARASSEGLIHVRIDHKIADCLELEQKLKKHFGLKSAWVSPGLGANSDPLDGLAPFASEILEKLIATETPQCIALGSGRSLRMAVKSMSTFDGSKNKLVSLVGNVGPDGSATVYEAIMRLAEKSKAKHYPMAIPVLAQTAQERELYHSLPHVHATRALALTSDFAVVGVGQMSIDAPLFIDGFITAEEQSELETAGAVGEICGHVFDRDGKFIDHPFNQRVVGTRVPVDDMPVYCLGGGKSKVKAIHGALVGGMLTGLITDEYTASRLLKC